MDKIKRIIKYFTPFELGLVIFSYASVITVYFLFDGKNTFNFITTLIGISMLIFDAKGNPLGQAITIVFSVLYSIESLTYSYYSELITYGFMTLPMAVISLIIWLVHPYKGNRAQVEVNRLNADEIFLMLFLTGVVTALCCYIMIYLDTPNIIVSTISIATSFSACFLTAKRSPYFLFAYALNDLVLVILWALAAMENPAYISILSCFAVFLINDTYGFINWLRLGKKQKQELETEKI